MTAQEILDHPEDPQRFFTAWELDFLLDVIDRDPEDLSERQQEVLEDLERKVNS